MGFDNVFEVNPPSGVPSGPALGVNANTGALYVATPKLGTWTAVGGSTGGGIQMARITVSSAHLLAGDVVQIVAAPSAGSYVVPIFVLFNYKFGGTAYTPPLSEPALLVFAGSSPAAPGGDVVWSVCDMAGVIDQLQDTIATAYQTSIGNPLPSTATSDLTGGSVPEADLDGQPLSFGVGAAPTLGNGTLVVTVWYAIVVKA